MRASAARQMSRAGSVVTCAAACVSPSSGWGWRVRPAGSRSAGRPPPPPPPSLSLFLPPLPPCGALEEAAAGRRLRRRWGRAVGSHALADDDVIGVAHHGGEEALVAQLRGSVDLVERLHGVGGQLAARCGRQRAKIRRRGAGARRRRDRGRVGRELKLAVVSTSLGGAERSSSAPPLASYTTAQQPCSPGAPSGAVRVSARSVRASGEAAAARRLRARERRTRGPMPTAGWHL